MDLNNITMDDLKAKFAAFDKKTLIDQYTSLININLNYFILI